MKDLQPIAPGYPNYWLKDINKTMSKPIKEKKIVIKNFKTMAGSIITIRGEKSEVLWWEKEMRKIFFSDSIKNYYFSPLQLTINKIKCVLFSP